LFALRMDAELDFAAASALERAVVTHISEHPDVHHVCLFAHPINRIDATGVDTVRKLEALLQERNITLHISGIKLPVETVLLRAGCLTPREGLRMYRTDAEAVHALQRLHAFTEDWHI
jgi:SulP family sulfate permease